MKILWFANSPCGAFSDEIKGTGGWLDSLAEELGDNKGIELFIAFHYPYKRNPFKKGNIWYYPIQTGNPIWEIIKKRFVVEINDKRFLSQYFDVINQINPDIINIQGTENVYHRIIGSINRPVIITIQGLTTVISKKYLSGFPKEFLRKITRKFTKDSNSVLLGNKPFLTEYNKLLELSKVEKDDLRKVKYIIGRTDWDRRVTRILAPHSKYYTCNEALRDGFYSRQWENNRKPEKKLIIHTTNGDSYFKGFETLCHSLKLLNDLGIAVEWRVAGVREDSLINKITKKFLKDDYPDRGLIFLGALAESELIESLLTSHIYVMPSHIENSPNNLCEAMIMGLPCVATNVGGAGSLLTDKEDGLLIQDGDPWAMAGAILELVSNWDRACEYGTSARKKALERHNKATIVQKLISVYESVINEK